MVQNLLIISLFLCPCLWFYITSLSPFLWNTQGSVIGPILLNMYTTPHHSHLIPVIKSSRDDTQIFISFARKIVNTAVSQLQDTISDISSWMTSKLLSLKPSKTEFMLIGLPQRYLKSTGSTRSSDHLLCPSTSSLKISNRNRSYPQE